MRTVLAAGACAATGAAIAVAALWVVLMYGPETLLHCEDAVYDADGTYHGLR